MKMFSDFTRDGRTPQKKAGGYEWWYFDAVDPETGYKIVVIFYEGNPFSPRYIKQLKKGKSVLPERYPAVSISVYEGKKPIYYSFSEFDAAGCGFGEDRPEVQMGDHSMEGVIENGERLYRIRLKEQLASGDTLIGQLEFKSPDHNETLFGSGDENGSKGHEWNLVQPCANVKGKIRIYARNEEPRYIEFHGQGYHDHNMGTEPMKDEFQDWYWGRFHFPEATLVYYVMNRLQHEQHRAWLVSKDNSGVLQTFEDVVLEDKGLSVFGLQPARKITMSNEQCHVTVQQSRLLDNGPYYQRFDSDAFLTLPEENIMEASQGISEYIRPARIYWRLFWPLIHMRVRYNDRSPHWVQKSKILYRWTW